MIFDFQHAVTQSKLRTIYSALMCSLVRSWKCMNLEVPQSTLKPNVIKKSILNFKGWLANNPWAQKLRPKSYNRRTETVTQKKRTTRSCSPIFDIDKNSCPIHSNCFFLDLHSLFNLNYYTCRKYSMNKSKISEIRNTVS